MLNDTIAAISTPLGEGGIAVIRVSGRGICYILLNVFFAQKRNYLLLTRIRYIMDSL